MRIVLNAGSYVWSAHYQKILRDIIPYKCEIVLYSELQNLKNLSKYDLLVTFPKNSKPVSIAQCVISPLFTSSDRIKVTEVVNEIIAKKKKEQFKTLFKLYFNENNFFVQTSLNKREDVLNFLCENLEKEKVVDREFRSSVFLREAIVSTDINGMYAIPHSMEFIAKKTLISVYINPKGIKWGDANVKVVFLSAINRKTVKHLRILYDFIIDLVSSPGCFSRLIQTKNMTEFFNCLFD